MSSQATDLGTVAINAYLNGDALNVSDGRSADWTLTGDIDATCAVYLERSSDLIHWDVLESFATGAMSESGTVEGPGHYRFRLQAGATAQSSTLDSAITDVADVLAPLDAAATPVATTGATASSPYGYTEAQANAIIAAVNALIVRQDEIAALLVAKNILAP